MLSTTSFILENQQLIFILTISIKIFLVGFDGFKETDKINDYNLFNENQKILNFYDNRLNLIFLSETTYDIKNKTSIFKYLT